MKRISVILVLLVCLLLTALPYVSAQEADDLQLRSFYYGIDFEAGFLGHIAPGTSQDDLFSRLLASDTLSLSDGVKTGSSLSIGNTPCMKLVVQGDCNTDGSFDVADALLLKALILEKQTLNDAQKQAADVNSDASVDIADYMLMKRSILGIADNPLLRVPNGEDTDGLLLSVGDTALFGQAGDPVAVEGDAVTWSDGVITAEAPGTALLTSGSSSLLVTVCREGLQVSLPDTAVSLKVDETFQVCPSINHPVDADITYSVSDTKLAAVSETGLVTALDKGTVTVTATLPNGHSDSQTLNIRNRYTVCVDAGHANKGIYTQEPIGPGSTTMKTALSGGTQGKATYIHEAELNLVIALMLKEELIARGYDVVMTRETEVCTMTNSQRALFAAESGADIYVRIHADGSDNTSKHGAFTCAPSNKNPFLTKENIAECQELSQAMLDAFCERTGAYNRGLFYTDSLTGCNWCTIPSTVIEMGFMSNAAEDRKMATDSYRKLMMLGIADGIDAYFALQEE